LAGQERSAFGKLARKHNIKGTYSVIPLSTRQLVDSAESTYSPGIHTIKK